MNFPELQNVRIILIETTDEVRNKFETLNCTEENQPIEDTLTPKLIFMLIFGYTLHCASAETVAEALQLSRSCQELKLQNSYSCLFSAIYPQCILLIFSYLSAMYCTVQRRKRLLRHRSCIALAAQPLVPGAE